MRIQLFLFLIVAAVFYAVFAYARREHRLRELAERSTDVERDIVRAAMLRGGRITALSVKTRIPTPVAEIEERLRAMHAHGYCRSELTPDGEHVYTFQEFDDQPHRALALERQILMEAKVRGGEVQVEQLALVADASCDALRATLEEMADKGYCRRTEHPSVYDFAVFGAESDARVPPRRADVGSESEPARPRERANS